MLRPCEEAAVGDADGAPGAAPGEAGFIIFAVRVLNSSVNNDTRYPSCEHAGAKSQVLKYTDGFSQDNHEVFL